MSARTPLLLSWSGITEYLRVCLARDVVERHRLHGFSRYHKYTLGTDLRDVARRALKPVVRADEAIR